MNEWCPVKHNICKIKRKPRYMRKMPHFSNKSINKITSAQSLSRVWLFHHPMDYIAHQGSSINGIFPDKNPEVGWHSLLQGLFPTQGSNPHLLCLLHCREILYHWTTSLNKLYIFKSSVSFAHLSLYLFLLLIMKFIWSFKKCKFSKVLCLFSIIWEILVCFNFLSIPCDL